MNEKIRAQQVERKAIIYIRPSSAYQVTHNLESQKLQYATQDRVRQLRWRELEVIDEIWDVPHRALWSEAGLNAWWRKCAWGRSERWRLETYRGLRATAKTGNNWWKSVALWIPC